MKLIKNPDVDIIDRLINHVEYLRLVTDRGPKNIYLGIEEVIELISNKRFREYCTVGDNTTGTKFSGCPIIKVYETHHFDISTELW